MKLSEMKVIGPELQRAAEQARKSVAAIDVPNLAELTRPYETMFATDYIRKFENPIEQYARAMQTPGLDAIAKLRSEVHRLIQPIKMPGAVELGLPTTTFRSHDPTFVPGLFPRNPIDGFLTNVREQLNSALMPATELARIGRWSSTVNQATSFSDDLLARYASFRDPIREIHSAVEKLRESFDMRLYARPSTIWEGHFEVTRQKMSFAAGARDIFGFHSDLAFSAQQSLLGSWRTTPNLPRSFWKDRDRQHRFFEEANVDAGLIDATPEVAVELMIESGFAAGGADDTTETLSIGALEFSIRTGNQRDIARQAIDALELELRAFIASKLSARVGPKWFKQRAPGALHAKAKTNREQAMGNGEREANLLAYVDLGDLGAIVTQGHNWDEEFGAVFGNRDRFLNDIRILASRRRPVAHARPIHAVMLLELVATAARLSAAIKDGGTWRLIAESDE